MQIRKWLALLVSAALALSLLAGCGGKNQSLAQVILDLLDGQYANVAVEIDPDLEADLRQAVHEGETEEEIRAALEKILGSGVSFRLIGDGQQGDTAWNLILYPGSDPDAAARSAFTEWSKVFGSLPRDGQYTAQIAMIETENGYAILVKATVDKAASRDDDDDDDEPEEPEDPGYTVDDGNYTVNDSDGLQNLLTGQANEAQEITAARAGGFEDVTIKLAAGKTYTVSNTFTTAFKGILKGEDEDNKATINIADDCNGLFKQIESNGKVENITFNVQTAISNTYTDSEITRAGAVADKNNGIIQNCDVTINADGSITANGGESDDVYAGGIVGTNESGGKISGCKVTINGGSITADGDGSGDFYAGGLVGSNEKGGEISGCKVTINGGSITATNESTYVCAGGIAGENRGTISNCHVNGGDISANNEDGVNSNSCAGGIAGYNRGDKGTVENCSVTNCKIKAGGVDGRMAAAGGIVGGNHSNDTVIRSSAKDCDITAQLGIHVADHLEIPDHPYANAHAGTKTGFDEDTGKAVG